MLRKSVFLLSVISFFPVLSFASSLPTKIDFTAGAGDYAFTDMVRPSFSLGVRQLLGDSLFLSARDRYTLANKDPNGGYGNTLSLAGGGLWHLNSVLSAGAFGEAQQLWYGPHLHNTSVGVGLLGKVQYDHWFAALRIADLFGVSGNIGYDLQGSGDDYLFSGKLGYQISRPLAVYGYLMQQRYVQVASRGSNSLTFQGAGIGLSYRF